MRTRRPTLGHTVLCAAFRNPIVMIKQITTLDVVSGSRAELGLGADWFEPDWRDYGMTFPSARERLPIIRSRCEEIDRDPATLAVSAELWWDRPATMHLRRVEQLEEIKELGLSCVQTYFSDAIDSDEPIIAFAKDCRAAGFTMLERDAA